MLHRTLLSLIALPLLAFQTDDIKSGPALGEGLPGPFHAFNVNGAHAGNPHCLVCEHGLNPVIAVFARTVPDAGSPLAQFLQKLDQAVTKNKRASLGGFAIFLAPDVEKEAARIELERRLQELAKSVDLKQIVLAIYGNDGPPKYKINADADVTILLYRKYRVVSNHSFRKDKLASKDAEAILASLPKLLSSD